MTKLHIENLNITLGASRGGNPLLEALCAMAIEKDLSKAKTPAFLLPKVGDKWPGTEAIYAGKSLSRDGSKIVDLIYWPDASDKGRNYADNIAYCESVDTKTGSHAATRQQAIVLNNNLRHLMKKGCWYWTETKDNDGDAAFVQYFYNGDQYDNTLHYEYRALAVSEIH